MLWRRRLARSLLRRHIFTDAVFISFLEQLAEHMELE